jgi:hypothetical protein
VNGERLQYALFVLGAACVCGGLLFSAPLCFRGNWYIFHRAAAAGLLWLPIPPRCRWTRALETCCTVLGLLGAANFTTKMITEPERADAEAIIHAVPLHSRVAPVWYSWTAPGVSDAHVYVHHAAYVIVRRSSEVTTMFSRRFGTFPVRGEWSPDAQLPEPGFEWSRSFDPNAAYARYFDTVLVRTPDSAPTEDPAPRVFGKSASRAQRLAHFGRFWLYRLDAAPAASH